MTEVARSLVPTGNRITSIRQYEAAPPLVESGETVATTKEEEWISKKKTEVTNTKQIETRVKRQVVLEDGKVVEDSGPMVTTNTTEDVDTQEHHQTELRKLGDDSVDGRALEGARNHEGVLLDGANSSVVVANADGLVREVKERKVVSREETEELKETEDVQHLGDITDEDFVAAVHSGHPDLREVLRHRDGVVSTGPRLLVDTKKSRKTVDTEDTQQKSSVREDGRIVTETLRTAEHEVTDDRELPEDEPDQNYQKESSQRYLKTRDQEEVDYIANGVNVGHEMRFKTETMEADRRGDLDEPDLFESLSARARKRGNNRQPYRQRGLEEPAAAAASPLDRKDALTRRPIDFDQEEETRKSETSKWLEHHFGSESTIEEVADDEEEAGGGFFNVTIKSQPAPPPPPPPHLLHNGYGTVGVGKEASPRVYSPVEPERDRNGNNSGGYYKGITDWSPPPNRYNIDQPVLYSRRSPGPYSGDRIRRSPSPDYRSPVPDYRNRRSPVPDYSRNHQHSPVPDYAVNRRVSEVVVATPTPPRRTKNDKPRPQRFLDERSRHDSDYRSSSKRDEERINGDMVEPPPDYSPPSPPNVTKKQAQKTRFAVESSPKPQKTGNIIGQSIRKLVGKIRSASAERKARQRAKRSPSPPTYQPGHVIDGNIVGRRSDERLERLDGMQDRSTPVQRYYLGEDPFGGSIFGRENKYEGARPARMTSSSRRPDDRRSQSQTSTLGRFSKSTSRLTHGHGQQQQQQHHQQQHQQPRRSSQTLPRHLTNSNKSNSTINVSIINTVSSPRKLEGPAKPQRTYKSNLSRSKSLNVPAMYASNPQLDRPLKSPGLISSLNRSQKDLREDLYTHRFARNGTSDNKTAFLSSLKDRAPELFKTLEENNSVYNEYEPPTRLRANCRRGSASSTDFSETYRAVTRSEDPLNPCVTDTVKRFSRRTAPSPTGRGLETVEATETKVSRSSGRYGRTKVYQQEDRWFNGAGSKPVIIEVRNYK